MNESTVKGTQKFLELSNTRGLGAEQLVNTVLEYANVVKMGYTQTDKETYNLRSRLENSDLRVSSHSTGEFTVISLSSNTDYTLTFSLLTGISSNKEPKFASVALSKIDYKKVWGRTEFFNEDVKVIKEDIVFSQSLIEGVRVKQEITYYTGEELSHTNVKVSFNGIDVVFSH